MSYQPRSILQINLLLALINEPLNAFQVYIYLSSEANCPIWATYPVVHRGLKKLQSEKLIKANLFHGHVQYRLDEAGRKYLRRIHSWAREMTRELTNL